MIIFKSTKSFLLIYESPIKYNLKWINHGSAHCSELITVAHHSQLEHIWIEVSSRGLVANVLNSYIVVSEFDLQSRYNIYFRTYSLGQASRLKLKNTTTAFPQKDKTPPSQRVSCLWQWIIWWWGSVLNFWGMWSTPLLPLLPGPLWIGVVAPGRTLFMDQMTYAKLNCLK